MRILILIFVVVGVNSFISPDSMSCPVPVFRYALEYWDAAPYRVEIFYKNSLESEEEELLIYFLRTSDGSDIKANLEIRKIDIQGKTDDATRNYISNLSPAMLPRMVLRYPYISGNNNIVWSGSLNKVNIDQLLNSPARKNIAEKLARETTAVWILLESGDRRKDQAAFDVLERELRRLEQTLQLPDPELWWDHSKGTPVEKLHGINFNIVRLSRNDPREEYLVNMLLNSERDLTGFDAEPIVFPVYGRGIILYSIVGKGINDWNIGEAAAFITGPCSCQARLLNPGIDLLISMDWDKIIENLTDLNIANPLSGIGDFTGREEEARRLLESATVKRMGNENIKVPVIITDSGKAVYRDIEDNNRRKVLNEVITKGVSDRSGDVKKTAFSEEEEEHDMLKHPEQSDDNSHQAAFGNNSKRSNFLKMPVVIFTGIIVLVLLTGVFLYRKAVK
ncbi:MAG TPA: hypothetical protein DDW27_13975 [Bacteroidales bacterium]|nr:hypothetical protein [Bacteroidales bacterium]